jgi:hypothetical protein
MPAIMPSMSQHDNI